MKFGTKFYLVSRCENIVKLICFFDLLVWEPKRDSIIGLDQEGVRLGHHRIAVLRVLSVGVL